MHNLSTLLLDIAKDLSEYGYANSSVPIYLKTYLAGELLNVLPRAFVDRCFEIYFENKCRYVDCKFVNGSNDNEVAFVFNHNQSGDLRSSYSQRMIQNYQPYQDYLPTTNRSNKSPVNLYKSPISSTNQPKKSCLTCTNQNDSSSILSPQTNKSINKVTRKIQMSSPPNLEKSTVTARSNNNNNNNDKKDNSQSIISLDRGRPKIRPQTACFNLMQNTMSSTASLIPSKISKLDNDNHSAFTENSKFNTNNNIKNRNAINVSPVESEAIEQAIEKAIVRNTDNMIMEEAIGKVLDKNRQLIKTKSLNGENLNGNNNNNERRVSSSPENVLTEYKTHRKLPRNAPTTLKNNTKNNLNNVNTNTTLNNKINNLSVNSTMENDILKTKQAASSIAALAMDLMTDESSSLMKQRLQVSQKKLMGSGANGNMGFGGEKFN